MPAPTDVYNPNSPRNGNSNWGKAEYLMPLDWSKTAQGSIDLRLFYTSRDAKSWSKCRWIEGQPGAGPNYYRISAETGTQICYTSEALRYAQSAYLIAVVVMQWADLIVTKTRTLSLGMQGMTNMQSNGGLVFETAVVIIIVYVPFLHPVFASRSIAFPHLGVPVFPWFTTLFLYDELRKIFLRNGLIKVPGKRVVYDGWIARNTYY